MDLDKQTNPVRDFEKVSALGEKIHIAAKSIMTLYYKTTF